MLMMKERRTAFRTIEGCARSVLLETGAIRECEEHGWMRDRADPHAREHATLVAREDPPPGVSPEAAAAAIEDVLGSIGDTCPECPGVVCWADLRCLAEDFLAAVSLPSFFLRLASTSPPSARRRPCETSCALQGLR
jgi:hypothetical protein